MDCVINNFKKNFSIAENVNNIDLSQYPIQKEAEIRSYVEQANLEAQQEGYSKPLFELGFREVKRLNKHANHRDNISRIPFLKVMTENIQEFENHLQQELANEADMRIERDANLSEDLTSFDQDELISNEALSEQDRKDSLFSYSVTNQDPLNLDPQSYFEWKQSLMDVKENLEKLIDRYTRLKDSEKLKEIYTTLEEIEKNIASIDASDPNNIYESSIREVELLDDFLNRINLNPEEGAQALDSYQLLPRIENLSQYFLAIDPKTGKSFKFEELDDDSSTIAQFYFDFKKGLNPEKSEELERKVADLQRKFERAQVAIVKGILTNDTLVKQLMEQGKRDSSEAIEETGRAEGWTQEDLDTVLDIIESGDVEISMMSRLFLGASSGGGILGQLLKSLRDNQLSRERGHTQERLTNLQGMWTKIKDKFTTENDTQNFIISRLFKKDEFGVRTRELIQRYTPDFYQKAKDVKAEKGKFYQDMSRDNYKSWMDADKESFQRINPMMLSSIAAKYNTHPEFQKYFTYSDAEIYSYERELREKLGNVMYDIEVKRAADLIENYADALKYGTLTVEQEFRRNPFEFIKHYESANYADTKGAWYMEPNFVNRIPSNKDMFFDDSFDVFEGKEHSEELADFYKEAYSLITEYINPVFRSEGVYRSSLELMTFEDMNERETTKSYNWFGKLSNTLAVLWANQRARYYDRRVNQQREQIKQLQNKTFEKNLQVGYVGYAKQEHNRLTTIFNGMSNTELFKLAKDRGYDVNSFPPIQASKAFSKFKNDLADSIARDQINESTSTNIFESIRNASFLANDINARRASVATLEAMKSYVKGIKSDENQLGFDDPNNTRKFLDTWGDVNIYGYKFKEDMKEEKGEGLLSKATRVEMAWIPKYYSEAEKKIKSFIKDEKKNNNNGKSEYNFTKEDTQYFTGKDGNFYKSDVAGVVSKIERSEISSEYGSYLQSRLDELGVTTTVGGTALGIMTNIILSQLGFSPRGGMRNRGQGMNQTMATAASKRYGFNLKHYQLSRRFLMGTNTRKYILNENFKKSKRGQQIETFKLFQDAMQLHQNRADEMALDGKFDKVSGGTVDKIRTFWMDFSINNPEWHNQTEIMTSILQTVDVVDKDGVSHKFFDGKTQESIYKPGTLELKDNFDTPDNRAMWVEFRETESGKGDSLFTVSKIKHAIHQTQGNYDNNDIIAVQSSVSGKLATMYQRYLFENTNIQWGEHKVDIRSGEIGVRGRKVELFRHAPTAAVFLTGMHGIQIATGIAIGLSPVGWAIAGTAMGTTLGMAIYRKKLKLKNVLAKQELLLAMDFARETAYRLVNTPVTVLSYGTVSPLEKAIDKLQTKERAEKRNLTLKERLLLSESAQDISSKFLSYAKYTLWALLAKAAWLSFKSMADWDDDDEEENKSRLRKITEQVVDIEGYITALINDRNILMSENDKFSNPAVFIDEAAAVSYARTVSRNYDFIVKDLSKWADGEKEWDSDMTSKALISSVFVVKPNHLVKSVLSSDKGMFTDNRVYSGKSKLDKKIFDLEFKESEKSAKKKVSALRADIKKEYVSYWNKNRDAFDKELSSSQIDAAIEAGYRAYIKDTYKSDNFNYKQILETTNWDLYKKAYRLDYKPETPPEVNRKDLSE